MADPIIRTRYISASANRFHKSAAINPSGTVVAFASSTYVALWKPTLFSRSDPEQECSGVLQTLPAHKSTVTCVQFSTENRLVSADEDGVLHIWHQHQGTWESVSSRKIHAKSVSALATFGALVITGSSDSCVHILRYSPESLSTEIIQTIDLGGPYPLDIVVSTLPLSNSLFMALASTTSHVEIWTLHQDEFQMKAILTGHEDWVRSLAIATSPDGGRILASGSQDGIIRLWRLDSSDATTGPSDANVLLDDGGSAFASSDRNAKMSSKLLTFDVASSSDRCAARFKAEPFVISLDAVLIGHEGSITSLDWEPHQLGTGVPQLLSTSTDSSLILWTLASASTFIHSSQSSDSLWIVHERFGDIGGQRLGGFVGGFWGAAGEQALAYGWNGGFRRWHKELNTRSWTEVNAISGHQAPVKGLAWTVEGEYLLSASSDQTTRIHCSPSAWDGAWREIARPQVHGYDIVDVVSLDQLRFLSIADEKTVRVFEATANFVSVMKGLGHFSQVEEFQGARSAKVPPLGLSNRTNEGDEGGNSPSSPTHLFEGELSSSTLWPEIEKLFGHGYEVISATASSSRKIVATACKATNSEHAALRLYNTQTWQPIGLPLHGHTLTVTRMSWSFDDKYLLSVSRDRFWRIFSYSPERDEYTNIASNKAHGRVIWDCAWMPNSHSFATASRDKTVKLWHDAGSIEQWKNVCTVQLQAPATAISFSPGLTNSSFYALAVGLESGEILFYAVKPANLKVVTLLWHLDTSMCCADIVHRLEWRPTNSAKTPELAAASEDGSVRIFEIDIAQLLC